MRQRTGALVCPHCGKLIGIDEPTCPFCGAWRPGLFGWTPVLQRLFGRRLNLVALIVTASVTLYGVALLLEPEALARPAGLLSLLAPGSRALYQLGMTGGIAWQLGWWWTLLTAIYLHGGLLHLVFNVLWIRDLGPVVTELYGPARAFVIFTVAGAIGFLLSNLLSGAPTIGASGSIFGLLAALLVYGRRRGGRLLRVQVWQWAVVLFVFGFLVPGVNNLAHLGGFLGGGAAAALMRFDEERRESVWMMLLALVLLGLTAAGFVLSFYRVTRVLLVAA
jgi:rhomboid protease GluP